MRVKENEYVYDAHFGLRETPAWIGKRYFTQTNMKNGLLFLIGGAEDKRNGKAVLTKIVDLTHAQRVVIIPTASSYPRDIIADYTHAFTDLGIAQIDQMDIRYRDETDRPENLEMIAAADLLFFGGGDQTRLVKVFNQTRLFHAIQAKFAGGQLHIAGTSAGAAAAGNPMIYNGDYKGHLKGSVKITDGLGLLDGVAVDTHFSARKRIPRLAQLLISGRCTRGIGLDEDTGIVIHPNLQFTVIGSRMVTIMNSMRVSNANFDTIAPGERLRFNNLSIGFLPPGAKFSIKRWAILK